MSELEHESVSLSALLLALEERGLRLSVAPHGRSAIGVGSVHRGPRTRWFFASVARTVILEKDSLDRWYDERGEAVEPIGELSRQFAREVTP